MPNNLSIAHDLNFLDFAIFSLVLGLTALSVWWGHAKIRNNNKSKTSLADYLLMGRQLTLPLFIATLVSTWYGGIFPVTELAYREGIFNFITQGCFWYITYIFFALFISDKIRESKPLTLPDLVHKTFGPKSAKLVAYFNFADVLPIAYTLSLGYFLQVIFGGELFVWVIIGTLIVALYSIYGGFRGVVYSDLIQFGTMIIGVFLVILFSLNNYGGLSFLKANLPSTHFEFTGTQNISQTLLWGFIALGTLVNPGFHQRCYAAKSNKIAKRGIVLATFIWFCFDICTTLGGMYARAVLPNIDPNSAYLTYAIQLLPSGLKGFFLAAILATILSTLDSFLFIAGTTLSYDFKLSKKLKLNHARAIFLASLISICIAMIFNSSILTIWKTVGSFNAACILLPLMLGLFSPKLTSDKTFYYSMILTASSMAIYKFFNYWSLDAFYIGTAVSFLTILISLLLKPPKSLNPAY